MIFEAPLPHSKYTNEITESHYSYLGHVTEHDVSSLVQVMDDLTKVPSELFTKSFSIPNSES